MRAKFAAYGAEIFDTYEILEMLLYSVIPYKDTNPIAKRLLYAFGSLEGVFSASEEELMSVQGVGKRVAELIGKAAEIPLQLKLECDSGDCAFEGVADIKRLFVNHYKECGEYKVSVLYLDNSMHPIELCDIYDTDFDSSAVQPKDFIDIALKKRASVAVIAHNHPFGPDVPSPSDRVTNNEIKKGLSEVGVNLIEHFVVCGENASGMMENFERRLYQKLHLRQKSDTPSPSYDDADFIGEKLDFYCAEDESVALLGELIEPVCRGEGRAIADKLLLRFGTLEYIFQSGIDELSAEVGEGAAGQIKILAAITSRRVTDSYKPYEVYSTEQILDYLKALYLYEPVEVVYLISLDKESAFIACDKVASGTVNCSEIIPRKMLEIAAKRGAKSVIIAHNHPRGKTRPSDEDMQLTCVMMRVFATSQIRLDAHYIISGQESSSVKIDAT
ncbi:MAG: hypothetical protein IJX92_03575 [Clostridia bacterium]|nr:hypothetical protein [Clostridia bacterium]